MIIQNPKHKWNRPFGENEIADEEQKRIIFIFNENFEKTNF